MKIYAWIIVDVLNQGLGELKYVGLLLVKNYLAKKIYTYDEFFFKIFHLVIIFVSLESYLPLHLLVTVEENAAPTK